MAFLGESASFRVSVTDVDADAPEVVAVCFPRLVSAAIPDRSAKERLFISDIGSERVCAKRGT